MANLKKKDNVAVENEDTMVGEFLCGYEDEDGVTHTEFEYREMTGADEEAISRNNIKNSGSKVVSTILERCILRIGTITKADTKPNKWSDMIKHLNVHDQDYAVMEIRRMSVGSTVAVKHVCPSCKSELNTEFDFDELTITPFGGERVLEFELRKGYKDRDGIVHKNGKVRFPVGLDREILEPIARNNIGQANTLLLSRCVVELGTAKVNDAVVRSLTSGDREIILNTLRDNDFGYNFDIDVDCPNCGNTFKGELSAINFM